MSPKVFSAGPYRFYFFASDKTEPIHVHVRRDDFEAKFWLDPLEVAYNHGFSEHELNKIVKIVKHRRKEIKEKWNDFFTS